MSTYRWILRLVAIAMAVLFFNFAAPATCAGVEWAKDCAGKKIASVASSAEEALREKIPKGETQTGGKGKTSRRATCGLERPCGVLCTVPVMDLHGCTLAQAKGKVSGFVRKHQGGRFHKLQIITGRGKHSPGGRAVLKHKVPPFVRGELGKKCEPSQRDEGAWYVYLE